LDIFDTAGQEDFSAVRDQFMRSGDGFLCVYSVTYAVSWIEVTALHEHILKVKDLPSVPFVLVGNKCDLEKNREVTREKGLEIAQKLGCKWLESSAKAEINVKEAFFTLVREIRESRLKQQRFDPKQQKKKNPCRLL